MHKLQLMRNDRFTPIVKKKMKRMVGEYVMCGYLYIGSITKAQKH